ncbi:MAG: hypothetical protein HN411_03010 [Waddliaceae bacterium]|jgi:Fe-S-cluster containining protein|nr:hypothetical protein [Waddliaceae bacterium]MBT3578618.1 hypothetical protein [Waddliaceae bacterium]MBT4445544.1 hypothetical protein [Waddliaceae bacterium]MBT6928395.1 hypothetical protein [Waddliaceae bacterium]MBT7265081.1 hypothetical protein [Waddliaceae bacterium]
MKKELRYSQPRDCEDRDNIIPKQWLSPLFRWPLRVIMLPFVALDMAANKIASSIVRPPRRKTGKCARCGKCCHYILITAPRSFLGKGHLVWNTQVNGFYLRNTDPVDVDGEKMLVVSCRYLMKNGKCGCHILRPLVCRQWPRIERFGKEQITEGCSYHRQERQ